MVFELTGRPVKIDAFLLMFQDYNILELCRTGVTALERGGMHPAYAEALPGGQRHPVPPTPAPPLRKTDCTQVPRPNRR